jgi:hypothetical protein
VDWDVPQEYKVVLVLYGESDRCSSTYHMVVFMTGKVLYMVLIPWRMSNEMIHIKYEAVVLILDENVEWYLPHRIQRCTNPRRMSDEMFHNKYKVVLILDEKVEWDVPQRIQSCTNPRRMSNMMFHNKYKVVLILDEKVKWDVPQQIQSCTNPRRMLNMMFHNEYKVVLILDECRMMRCSTMNTKLY